jgi:hypothetical protein
MGVNSVMSINNMNSFLNSVYKINGSQASIVPMVNSVDATVKNDYTSNRNSGQDTNVKIQDIYRKVDPTYDMPVTYNKSGDLTLIKNTTPSIDSVSPANSNRASLIQSNSSATSSDIQSILSQYTAIETKTFQPNISSGLSANLYNSYSTTGSLANASMQNTGNFVNVFV